LKLRESNEARVYDMAEMENVRRIAKVDVERARAYAAQPIAKGLLLAVDNLSAAVAAVEGKVDAGVSSGLSATLKIFLKVLGEHGVAQFGAPGEKFDPNVHEAVGMVPGEPPNTLSAVLKTGFMFKDRVLRPAQVIVTMKGESVAAAEAAAASTAGSSRSI
jgi:molecular chaperone GrpE